MEFKGLDLSEVHDLLRPHLEIPEGYDKTTDFDVKKYCAYYGVIVKDAEGKPHVAVNRNTACHAGLGNKFYNGYSFYTNKWKEAAPFIRFDRDNLLFVWDSIQKPHARMSRDKSFRYLQWMMNESPMRDAFLLKDPALALDIGAVLLDSHGVSRKVMVHAAVSNRMTSEYPVGANWCSLVDDGMDPNLAFFVAHRFGKAGKIYTSEAHVEHTPQGSDVTYGNFLAFLYYSENKTPVDEPYADDLGWYDGIANVWTKLLQKENMVLFNQLPNRNMTDYNWLSKFSEKAAIAKVKPSITYFKDSVTWMSKAFNELGYQPLKGVGDGRVSDISGRLTNSVKAFSDAVMAQAEKDLREALDRVKKVKPVDRGQKRRVA